LQPLLSIPSTSQLDSAYVHVACLTDNLAIPSRCFEGGKGVNLRATIQSVRD
jgi:hypothetical protein